MKRWLAVLSPVTMFGVLGDRAAHHGLSREQRGDARHLVGLNRWESEWASNGGELLRILRAL